MPAITTYEDAHAAIWSRSGWDRGYISNPFAGDDAARLGLARTRLLLDALGRPDERYPIVHVAGSKGKGSTCALIDSVFRASGLRSGRFLSPHLHDIRERFVANDVMIAKDEFTSVVATVMESAEGVERGHSDIGLLTAWEISTAIALEWWSRKQCDIAVLEVGLGGLLDATNVITPAVSVITRLDFEHTAILGTTMAEIAFNKAGIIKPGIPAVTVTQPLEGAEVIVRQAEVSGSLLLVQDQHWSVAGSSDLFSADGPGWSYRNLSLSLVGDHQVENAGLAIAATELLGQSHIAGYAPNEQALRAGLHSAVLPGRFEVFVDPSGTPFVLDGAHTPESTSALAAAVEARYPGWHVVVVAGLLEGRDPNEVLPPLLTIADRIILTVAASPRALPVDALASTMTDAPIPVNRTDSVLEALSLASEVVANDRKIVVITGSFSVVSAAREALGIA